MADKKVDHVKQYFNEKREKISEAKTIDELLDLLELSGNLPNPHLKHIADIFENQFHNDLEKCRNYTLIVINGMQYKLYN